MSYTVTTGYRRPVYTFATSDEADRFNAEYFNKTKVHGAIVIDDVKPTYLYDADDKLRRV